MTTKRFFATIMALIMALLTPLMVFAADVAEEAVIEEVRDDDVVEVEDIVGFSDNLDIDALAAVGVEDQDIKEIQSIFNQEDYSVGGYNGMGFFTDSYNGIDLVGDDGKATFTISEGSRELVQKRVANNGFIQRYGANCIILLFINGAPYGYCPKYQGLNGQLFKICDSKVTNFNYDGNSKSLVTTTGEVSLPDDAKVREILGISSDSGKDDGSSSGKDDESSSSKDDGSSSGKDDGSSSGKDDGSSSSKDDGTSSSTSSTIKVDDVIPAYGFVDVECTVNGQKITYRLRTGDLGEIQEAGKTADGLVYILFKDGKLVFWHPSMLSDLSQTDVNASDLLKVADNCKEIRIVNGVVEFYDANGTKISIPTVSTIKSYNNVILTGSYDYIVDNSVVNSSGYRTWTLLQKVNNRYYVVKNAESGVECKFEWVKKHKILYNGKKYNAREASWSASGDLFIKTKRKVFVIRQAKTKNGNYRNKKMRWTRRARELHIDPQTNLADYVVLRNGDQVSCVTGKKIN